MARNFNAEDYRQPWESEEHWDLRKEFLATHAGKFTEDRLLCLAQAFVNVELLGCSYPAPVMRQIAELAKNIKAVKAIQGKRQERAQVQFVKEQNKSKKVKRNGQGGPNSPQRAPKLSKQEPANVQHYQGPSQPFAGRGSTAFQGTTGRTDAKSYFSKEEVYTWSNNADIQSKNTPIVPSCINQGELLPSSSPTVSDREPKNTKFPQVQSSGNSEEGGIQEHGSPDPVSSSISITPPSQSCVNLEQSHEQEKQKNPEKNPDSGTADTTFQVRNCPRSVQTPLEEKFCGLGAMIKEQENKQPNSLQLVQLCASKCHMKVRQTCNGDVQAKNLLIYKTCLYIEEVFISSGTATNKKQSKVVAYNEGVTLMKKPALHVVSSGNEQDRKLVECKNPCAAPKPSPATVPTKQTVPVSKNVSSQQKSGPIHPISASKLRDFLIVDDREVNKTGNAIGVLKNSAQYNHVDISFDFPLDVDSTDLSRCIVTLGTMQIGSGTGDGRQAAKQEAAADALGRLQQKFYTVKMKPMISDDNSRISKQQIEEGGKSTGPHTDKSISESNVGYKMLQQMGWTGGGIGKEGNTGISEPIRPQDVYKRAGLGFLGNRADNRAFRNTVQKMLEAYASSRDYTDLVFSSEFSKEQRQQIHWMAEQLRLKSMSRGKGPSRFLTISKRLNPRQLKMHLMGAGGSTEKYELIPPSDPNQHSNRWH